MQILSEILLQYIIIYITISVYYCHVFEDAPRITCHFTVLEEFKTQVINQLSRWPSGLAVRLEIKGSLGRYSAETYIFILNFSLVSLPYRSAEPLQMKSSMTIHL